MGGRSSKTTMADVFAEGNTPDSSLSSNVTTADENEMKRKRYAHLKSAAAASSKPSFSVFSSSPPPPQQRTPHPNVIEQVYNEDFETIDHIQAMRLPPYVRKQIKDAVHDESQRRCAETEKTMARCLQDKMWTSWKCQKERDAYYHCVEDEERRNLNPRRPEDALEGKGTTEAGDSVDLLTAYRWKFNLGVLYGEIIGRNSVMRRIWDDHFPDRGLPHPWVRDDQ